MAFGAGQATWSRFGMSSQESRTWRPAATGHLQLGSPTLVAGASGGIRRLDPGFRVLDVITGEATSEGRDPAGDATAVAMEKAPDSRILAAACSSDGTLRVWRLPPAVVWSRSRPVTRLQALPWQSRRSRRRKPHRRHQ